jgi:hypothetical protein
MLTNKSDLQVKIDDGGRKDAGFKGDAGDCVVRSIAIASKKPYMQVYNDLKRLNEEYAATRRNKVAKKLQSKGTSPRNGNFKEVYHKYLESLGFEWTPLMKIGTGCKYHLRKGEVPETGRYVLSLSRHISALIDGVIHDTYDPSRKGNRCVYGYYKFKG